MSPAGPGRDLLHAVPGTALETVRELVENVTSIGFGPQELQDDPVIDLTSGGAVLAAATALRCGGDRD